MAVPKAASLTCVVDPPSEGTVNGVPASPTKFTGNETAAPVRFVKYSAEYQPPPKTNCGRTLDAAGAADWTVGPETATSWVRSNREPPCMRAFSFARKGFAGWGTPVDRKSTRLNSSHLG